MGAKAKQRRRVQAAILADEPVTPEDIDTAYWALRLMTMTRPWVYNLILGVGIVCLLCSLTNPPGSLVAGPVLCIAAIVAADRGKRRYQQAIDWGDRYLPPDDK